MASVEEMAKKLSEALYRTLPSMEEWHRDWMVPHIADAIREAVIEEHNATVLAMQEQREDSIAHAVAEEREACAMVAEKWRPMIDEDTSCYSTAEDIAFAIRERGKRHGIAS